MPFIPSGTVTFLFTDIQNSTRLWEAHPGIMRESLHRHDAILTQAIENTGGYVFKTVGDAFCAAFPTAMDALNAAVTAQVALRAETWDAKVPIRVRMAIHTGEVEERNGDYYGQAVNRVARLEATAYGGQTVISLVTAELVRDTLPEGVELKDMGAHRLKDLARPETIYQVLHPALTDDFPPLKSLDSHPHNLPFQITPFFGREEEIRRITDLFTGDGASIVTLTGPGGIGKTRLALQAAADMIDVFPDGVFFVDLSPLDDAEFVIPVIARTLGLRERGGRPFRDILVEYLSGKDMLLILDNFEQIMPAEFRIMEMLKACRRLRFLVTSREAFNVRGEKVLAVRPLSLPEGHTDTGPDILGQYEAVRLFIDRARSARDDFRVHDGNAAAVAGICERLEGIPLAIELAAARVNLLRPEDIYEKLGGGFDFLSGGPRDLPPRHRTLRSAIQWSYGLLDGLEKETLGALSVFRGGFGLKAAGEVLAGSGVPRDLQVLDIVRGLADKSLVYPVETTSGEPRFAMLEPIREFAAGLTGKAGTADALADLHAAYYANILKDAAAGMEGPGTGGLLDAMELENGNISAALRRLVVTDRGVLKDILPALGRFWQVRGYREEAEDLLRALTRPDGQDPVDTPLASAAFRWMAVLARTAGRYREALGYAEEAVRCAESGEPAVSVAPAVHELGWTRYRLGDIDGAEEAFREAGNLYAAGGDGAGLAMARLGTGTILWCRGSLEQAEVMTFRAVDVFTATGLPRLEAQGYCNLGLIRIGTGDYSGGSAYLKKAADIQESMGDRYNLVPVLNNLAYLYFIDGKHDASVEMYMKMKDAAGKTADLRSLATAETGLAENRLALKDLAGAAELARQALKRVSGFERGIEYGIACRVLGEALLLQGEYGEARQHLEESVAVLRGCADEDELQAALAALERVAAES